MNARPLSGPVAASVYAPRPTPEITPCPNRTAASAKPFLDFAVSSRKMEAQEWPKRASGYGCRHIGRQGDSLNFDEFLSHYREEVETLFRFSEAAGWSVSFDAFARAVWQGVAAPAGHEPEQMAALLAAIRTKDLALALGCAGGNEAAWDTFCAQFRPALYDSARSLVHDEARARELADSLLAELYGLEKTEAGRNSRFAYFHGRSSLKTWLRAVLYQKFVDEYRRESRLAPLGEGIAEPPARQGSVSAEDDRRYADCLGEAVEAALADLRPPDKLLLSYYYVQELTLKEIGRLRGEHEATISRHLEAMRKRLRARIENHLRKVKKLSALEVEQCLDFASRGVSVKLEKVLKTE
jgi:RNA polymerase sigma-70 factor